MDPFVSNLNVVIGCQRRQRRVFGCQSVVRVVVGPGQLQRNERISRCHVGHGVKIIKILNISVIILLYYISIYKIINYDILYRIKTLIFIIILCT